MGAEGPGNHGNSPRGSRSEGEQAACGRCVPGHAMYKGGVEALVCATPRWYTHRGRASPLKNAHSQPANRTHTCHKSSLLCTTRYRVESSAPTALRGTAVPGPEAVVNADKGRNVIHVANDTDGCIEAGYFPAMPKHSTTHSTPHSTTHSATHSTTHSTTHSATHSTTHSTTHSVYHYCFRHAGRAAAQQ